MRAMQSKILPKNWLENIQNFDINKSNLSENNKIIATYLIPIILGEKEKSLANSLCRYLIEHVVFEKNFLKHYNDLSSQIIIDGFDEIKNEKGINLDRKLHSLFVEFITYQDLHRQGYIITEFTREQGSCDFVMKKDNKIFNFEVKFKESKDIGISRLYDYIDCHSLLNENEFLRGKTFEINLKIDNLTYSNIKDILNEIDVFISKKVDIYDGKYLQIFNSKKRSKLNRAINQASKYLSNFHIQSIEDVDKLICDIFISNNGHLTKLIKKSGRYKSDDNFTGCLAWSIPFHMDINNDKIKSAFEKINLDFDLFVYTGGISKKEEFNFFIPKKKGDI